MQISANAQPHFISSPRPAVTDSLLDAVGHLSFPIPDSRVVSWKRGLQNRNTPKGEAARLNLWLGEWQLGHDQQPQTALWHFRQVQRLSAPGQPLYNLAGYDGAMALYYEGAYAAAGDAFRALLADKSPQAGFDRRDCALWLRHAGACAGYHAGHARLGIPEPPQLDPLSGAAALAACLRGLSLPFGRGSVSRVCRFTGEGSTPADLLAAGQRLGAVPRAVAADDQGLQALPKPVVAYVEHDHFVAVVRADSHGVSYLCSDCGPWPGGRVDLTWTQWHALDPGIYVVLTKSGTVWDRRLAALTGQAPTGVRVASVGPLTRLLPSAQGVAVSPSLERHIHTLPMDAARGGGGGGGGTGPGANISALHCLPMVQCPMEEAECKCGAPDGGDPVCRSKCCWRVGMRRAWQEVDITCIPKTNRMPLRTASTTSI